AGNERQCAGDGLACAGAKLNDIVREQRAVTPDTARRLARYFDTMAQLWLNLQTSSEIETLEGQTLMPAHGGARRRDQTNRV
ncbi:MAG: HigA family addiction module antitoxin, partial [Azonexus sp.]